MNGRPGTPEENSDLNSPEDDIYGFADDEPSTRSTPTQQSEKRVGTNTHETDPTSTFRPTPTPSKSARGSARNSSTGENEQGTGRSQKTEKQPVSSSDRATKPASFASLDSEEEPASLVKRLGEFRVFGRVDSGTIAIFSRQLGIYLDSGLPITRALSSLRKQVGGTAMAPVVDRFISAVKSGEPISVAAERETQAFDPLFVSMLRVAEARGGLPETLKSLATYYESRQRMARQMRSALIYPAAVITIALGVGALLTFFVLPGLVALLEDITRGKVDLPTPTKLLIAFTKFATTYGWWLLPLVVVGLVIVVPRFYRTNAGKRLLDPWILRIPVMGKLIRTIETARMARTLGDLLGAGVPADASLKLTSEVVQFSPFKDAVAYVREEVKEGAEFAPSLKDTEQFPIDALSFIETGEETGTLPESLMRVAREYEERAEYMVKNLGSLLQPLFFLILGGFVGFIVIAFILAYVSIIASLTTGG